MYNCGLTVRNKRICNGGFKLQCRRRRRSLTKRTSTSMLAPDSTGLLQKRVGVSGGGRGVPRIIRQGPRQPLNKWTPLKSAPANMLRYVLRTERRAACVQRVWRVSDRTACLSSDSEQSINDILNDIAAA